MNETIVAFILKRKDTGQFRGDLLKIIDAFAKTRKLSITDGSIQQALLEDLQKEIEESRSNPIRLHGFRIETMFAYVAAALGSCKIVNEEDSGAFFHDESAELTRPDLRIVTLNNEQFFVEVKNHHGRNFDRPFRVTEAYFSKLASYAESMSIPLKFAIYWSSWNLWTLIDAERLKSALGKRSISFFDALKSDEMSTLGDQRIGTVPPLEIYFHMVRTDGEGPITEGTYQFTITEVQAFSGGEQITDPKEADLAFFFCRFGDWHDQKVETNIGQENKIIHRLYFAPEIRSPEQEFEILGTMSQMISKQYSEDTVKDHVITSISPSLAPDQFGAIIPKDYEGKDLRLWRMILKPNFDREEPGN